MIIFLKPKKQDIVVIRSRVGWMTSMDPSKSNNHEFFMYKIKDISCLSQILLINHSTVAGAERAL